MVLRAMRPHSPAAAHRAAHDAVFANWDDAVQGPRPTWFPDADALQNSNAARLCKQLELADWNALQAASIVDRDGFWSLMIERLGIQFDRPADAICAEPCDPRQPHWLPGARFNIAASCLHRDSATPAIRWGKADGSIEDWPMARLEKLSAQVAAGLSALGLTPGDAIAIDMPMTPESVAIYLGIIRAGMAAVSIADSFAPHEIATRLRISGAKLVFTQDVIRRAGKDLPLYAKVVEANAPRCVVVPAGETLAVTLRAGDIAFADMLGEVEVEVGVGMVVVGDAMVSADPADAINILFSSGTTGDPKAIPWDHTTAIKCAVDGHLHLDIRPGDVVCWPTNLGWMMGPWLIFAALINKATIALFDGAPLGEEFARFVQNAKVTMLGVVPSMVKKWRSMDCLKNADWTGIRCFGSTGECSNADDYFWLSSVAGFRPIIEYCGGTEIGGGYITGSLLQPQSPGTFSTPAVGLDLVLLEDEAKPAETGEVFLVPPSIGLSRRLLNRDHDETYFAGCPTLADGSILRRHGDQLTRLPGGYFRADGRTDDTMNLGGIKVSSAEIERVAALANGVQESAAVAFTPTGGGPDELVIFVVPPPGESPDATELLTEIRRLIKSELNPLFHVVRVELIPELPRTASNKVMRRHLRSRG